MLAEQEWCLHCGLGAPKALRSTPGWRALAAALVAVLVLAGGAGAAAYAALSKHSKPALPKTALSTVPTSTTTTTSTSASIPTIPSNTESASTPVPPPVSSKPPKIPLATPTPTTSTPAEESTTTSSTTTTTSTTANEEAAPILLDTDAASSYNPYKYPESGFGDPGLAIDGDKTTAWTAAVQASSAPLMAEGLMVNLKHLQRIDELELLASSTGMTIEVYGARSQQPPASITDSAWVQLARPRVLKKSKTKIKLHESSKSFRLILLWITKAPPGLAPANPGQVSVQELALFPPKQS